MSQQQRSPDESPAGRATEDAQAESGDTPLQSGVAPRADEAEADDAGEGDSLYDRLLRSGALEEVMEIAAREQSEPIEPGELTGAARQTDRPNSEVVPAGTSGQSVEWEVDLELLEEDEAASAGRLPANAPPPPLPSVMLGPDAAPRPGAATERVVLSDLAAVRRPSLTPQAARPGRESREQRAPVLVLVGLLCLTAGALVFWFATRPEPATPQATAAPKPAEPVRASASVEAVAEPAVKSTPASDAPEAPPEPTAAPEPAEPTAAPSPRAAAPARPRSSAAEARPVARKPATPPATEEPGLPEQPGRDEVVESMQAVTPALEECVAGAHGDVRLRMTVLGSGRVTHAVVQGAFEGTPAGSCLARAAREARFPEFSSRFVRLTYPVRL